MRTVSPSLPFLIALASVVVCLLFALPFDGQPAAAGDRPGSALKGGTDPGAGLPHASGNRDFTGTFVTKFRTAPFPYHGKYGDTDVNFFDCVDPKTAVRYHTNREGTRFPESEHYSDGSVLFHVPPSFKPKKPFAYVVFFHEINTNIRKSSLDYDLAGQIDASGKNVILVMPQMARDAADSSPGKFFRKHAFSSFMAEAAGALASKVGKKYRSRFEEAPIILAAFSGGYKAVAYTLDRGGVTGRIRGVILLDALYEDVDKFEQWIVKHIRKSFLVNIYTSGSCERNSMSLAAALGGKGLRVKREPPDHALSRGDLYFVPSRAEHMEVPVLGPPRAPLENLLRLVNINK